MRGRHDAGITYRGRVSGGTVDMRDIGLGVDRGTADMAFG